MKACAACHERVHEDEGRYNEQGKFVCQNCASEIDEEATAAVCPECEESSAEFLDDGVCPVCGHENPAQGEKADESKDE